MDEKRSLEIIIRSAQDMLSVLERTPTALDEHDAELEGMMIRIDWMSLQAKGDWQPPKCINPQDWTYDQLEAIKGTIVHFHYREGEFIRPMEVMVNSVTDYSLRGVEFLQHNRGWSSFMFSSIVGPIIIAS